MFKERQSRKQAERLFEICCRKTNDAIYMLKVRATGQYVVTYCYGALHREVCELVKERKAR